jgi:hypothetical protein
MARRTTASRLHGFLPACTRPCMPCQPLSRPRARPQARFEAEAAAAAAEAALAEVPAEFATVADALKRSPLMLEVGGDHPGLAAIAHLSDDLLIDASVALLREHGLMDAKEMVRNDATILLAAADKALAIREAEAAERAAEAVLAEVPAEFAAVADALKRSPLMLEVGGDHPGLAAISQLVRLGLGADC